MLFDRCTILRQRAPSFVAPAFVFARKIAAPSPI